MKKYKINTFGCQMNVHDSERLAATLEELGYSRTEEVADADLVVYNTCCVRENAENKMYGHLGYLKKLKEKNKGLKIAICGCMTQQDAVIEKIKSSYRWVDIMFGTFNLHRFTEYLKANNETGGMIIDIWKEHDESESSERAFVPSAGREIKHKSGINIMYGCDNFCSYCIVPYVRGRERSRKASDIVNEARELAADGVIELLLLGQNVNSYNHDGINFATLLRMICAIDGIERVRFMTSHPKDMSDELIAAMVELDKVCKSVHLPIQSGSTAILGAMNRKYTKEDYMSLVDRLRTAIPGLPITTDIIVGFPGETDDDFEHTLDLAKQVGFAGAFTFIYSKRTGTSAATMECQVPPDVASERFNRLINVLNPIIYEINKAQEGRVLNVIADEYDAEKGVLTGRSDCNTTVHFPANNDLAAQLLGKLTKVDIIEGKPFYLLGEIVE